MLLTAIMDFCGSPQVEIKAGAGFLLCVVVNITEETNEMMESVLQTLKSLILDKDNTVKEKVIKGMAILTKLHL